MLQMGVFKKQSGSAEHSRRYRLISVVEHLGNFAHKGHYICYSLDPSNNWIKFDDKKVIEVDYDHIIDNVQAYVLFYELIHEDQTNQND